MRRATIEPGLLSLFRLATVIGLILAAVDMFLNVIFASESITPAHILNLLVMIITLLALYAGGLRRRLGQAYLPFVLFIAATGAFATQMIDFWWVVNNYKMEDWFVEDLFLMGGLFVPLVIISAQYKYRVVLAFTFIMALLSLVFSSWILPGNSDPELVWESSIGLSIFYPAVGFLISRVVDGQKKEREALASKNAHLTQYATTVERLAVSHERNRMARELHDTLAHTLSGVSVQLEALNKQLDSDLDGAKQTLKKSRTSIRNGLEETRRALQALRTSALEDLGFSLAMRQLADAAAERSGMTVTLEMSGELDKLAPDVEQSVYRVTEEALSNAVRHAQARSVTITLQRVERELDLMVVDDGIGFDPEMALPNGHYGLIGMQERARLCNGRLHLESASDTGTMVRLTVGEQP